MSRYCPCSSKTSPIPHAYIRLPDPEKSFTPGVGYDVDVELELVRPRQVNSEDGGKCSMLYLTASLQSMRPAVEVLPIPLDIPR